MGDAPIVLDIGVDGVEGDGNRVLRLGLTEVVRIAQQEVCKSNTVITTTSSSVAIEAVSSGGVCEDLLVFMSMQPGEAEFEVMRAPRPGKIVLVLVTAPGVRPGPVPVVHACAHCATI